MERYTKAELSRRKQHYVAGFTLSIALTLIAYFFTISEGITGWGLFLSLAFLAVVQVAVQLLFFLHMREETEPRWKLFAFNSAILIIAIVVFGTLWIMANLDRHMMSDQKAKDYDDYIIKDEGYGR